MVSRCPRKKKTKAPVPARRTAQMPPANARPRIGEPASYRQRPVGPRLRRAPQHPASPRETELPEANAVGQRVREPRLPALAPSRGSLRRHGDVFVALDQIT